MENNLKINYRINRAFKRCFDIIFSFIFILFIFSWVSILVGIIIKFTSRGPIIFKQIRIGQYGHSFLCYKFRTMGINNQETNTSKNDSRIFPFGNILRKTNMDEFPQFINVLLGNMSIVGPRPYMISEDQELEKKLDNYKIRRLAKPGITGYAAIKGHRGGTKDLGLMQKRTNLDIEYVNKWTLALDFYICIATTFDMFLNKRKGH